MPLVSRLIGLETEYATLVADRQDLDRDDLPPSHMVYVQICEAIRRDQPTVAVDSAKAARVRTLRRVFRHTFLQAILAVIIPDPDWAGYAVCYG